jgi:hypothetical protein
MLFGVLSLAAKRLSYPRSNLGISSRGENPSSFPQLFFSIISELFFLQPFHHKIKRYQSQVSINTKNRLKMRAVQVSEYVKVPTSNHRPPNPSTTNKPN